MNNKCGRCANLADKGHHFCQDCLKALEKINHTPIKKKPRKNSRDKNFYTAVSLCN